MRNCGAHITPEQEVMNLLISTRNMYPEVYKADTKWDSSMNMREAQQLLVEDEGACKGVRRCDDVKEEVMVAGSGN